MRVSSKSKMTPQQQTKIGKRVGCGICGCLAGVSAFVGLIIYVTVFTNTCARMMGEETYPISGNPSQFDPFAAVSDIRAKLGPKAILLDLQASFVRSDGTLDLKATYKPAPRADYKFRIPLAEEPKDAPPIGAGRKPGDVWTQEVTVRVYEPGQRRSVTRTSGSSRTSYQYINEGMDFDRGSAQMSTLDEGLPDPKLSTKQMWEAAISKGSDKEAVARISYDGSGYQFTISELKFFLYWDSGGKFDEDRSRWPGKER